METKQKTKQKQCFLEYLICQIKWYLDFSYFLFMCCFIDIIIWLICDQLVDFLLRQCIQKDAVVKNLL